MLKSFGKLFKECGEIIREEYNNTVYEIKNDKDIKKEIEGIKNSIDIIKGKKNNSSISTSSSSKSYSNNEPWHL